ncbi:MAG: hypothetical protein QOJ85_2645 [Solirubrobacteraceae bacterium]|jgi:hypothetical protein|nr:hypothetical protein [Solirubrobacteraceae bacterium]
MPVPRRALTILPAAAVGLLGAAAAPAAAATIQTLPCNVDTRVVGAKTVPLIGSGFTPNGLVTIQTASAVAPTPTFLTSAQADAAGNIKTTASPPLFNKFDTQEQAFGLAATDQTNPAIVATTQFQQVRLGYVTNPSTGRPTRRATHIVRGFPVGQPVWLHYRFGGKTRRSVSLGTAQAPCGKAQRRMALLPTRSRRGKWTVYVDQVRRYSPATKPQLKYTFVISRRFV